MLCEEFFQGHIVFIDFRGRACRGDLVPAVRKNRHRGIGDWRRRRFHRLGRCDKTLRVAQLLLGQAVERHARQIEVAAVFDPHHRLAAPAAVAQKRFLVEPGGGADHEVVTDGNGCIVPVLAR